MKRFLKLFLGATLLLVAFSGCGKETGSISNAYSLENNQNIVYLSDAPLTNARGFASGLAVIETDEENSEGSDIIYSESALLINATSGEVLFQKNPHEKVYPASTTKILTSLLAIKYGDLNASRVIGNEVIIDEDNVVLCDYRIGDVIPFDIIIHGTLMRSGNDAAAALALFVSDSLDDFAVLMNEEAKNLGATNSNFVNPHGLYDDNHYTTAYDMYLIFNEAIKYDYFIDVISTKSYTNSFIRKTSYREYNIACSYTNSNPYISGSSEPPEGIKVIGGKSGYTSVAKRSYVMLVEANGDRYIVITMKCEDGSKMWEDIDYLLRQIPL